jgi:hypothetical protein
MTVNDEDGLHTKHQVNFRERRGGWPIRFI